ncbi:MAG: DUF445 domain-containing protein [Propioniciclava sp.]
MTVATLSPADEHRQLRLRRMKSVALGLLGLALVIYLVTLPLDHDGVWGFVNTMAEGAMVGALADWFAVTALFRHPLGLPIPHTAIIPRKKDELARSLESFIADNFLTEEVVRERITAARLASRLGIWAEDPEHARRVVAEALRVSRAVITQVDDESIRSLAADVILPRLAQQSLGPVLGILLEGVVDERAHSSLVDLIARELHVWLEANPTAFTQMLHDRAPRWAPRFLNQRVVSVLYWQALDWVASVRDDPDHPTRLALDDLLGRIALDLQEDSEVRSKVEAIKERFLGHARTIAAVVALWQRLRVSLLEAIDDPDSGLHERGIGLVQTWARSLQADTALQDRVDGMIADAASFLVRTYGPELSSVVSHTIERWDGDQAAQRIELYVGRDLQFIRINGTVVGALAGFLIHAVSQLF